MIPLPPSDTREGASAPHTRFALSRTTLERRSWRNWFLLLGVLVITTTGLVTALPPLLSERVEFVWPWQKTDLALLVAYSMTILVFAGYVTFEQRRTLAVRRRLEEEVLERSRRNTARLYALLNVSRIMGVETDLQGVFDAITKVCVETFKGEQASLMLFDSDTRKLEVRSAFGHADRDRVIGSQRDVGEGVAGWVAEHRRAIILEPDTPLEWAPGSGPQVTFLKAAMVAPIILRDELVGVMSVSGPAKTVHFDGEDLQALQVFAENAGTCIRHTEQARWMRRMIERSNVVDERKELEERGVARGSQSST